MDYKTHREYHASRRKSTLAAFALWAIVIGALVYMGYLGVDLWAL